MANQTNPIWWDSSSFSALAQIGDKLAVKVTPTENITSDTLYVVMQGAGTVSSDFEFSIQTDDNNEPSGTKIFTKNLNVTSITQTTYALTDTSITLNAHTPYWIVCETKSTQSGVNYVGWSWCGINYDLDLLSSNSFRDSSLDMKSLGMESKMYYQNHWQDLRGYGNSYVNNIFTFRFGNIGQAYSTAGVYFENYFNNDLGEKFTIDEELVFNTISLICQRVGTITTDLNWKIMDSTNTIELYSGVFATYSEIPTSMTRIIKKITETKIILPAGTYYLIFTTTSGNASNKYGIAGYVCNNVGSVGSMYPVSYGSYTNSLYYINTTYALYDIPFELSFVSDIKNITSIKNLTSIVV